MKKIFYICALLVTFSFLTGCSNEIETPLLTTDEYPRILGRWPDRQTDGELGVFEIPLNEVLVINVQYTPSNLCTGTWYLDGREVHKGIGYEYIPTTEGSFHIRLEVETPTEMTSREATILVVAPTTSEEAE